ncbi:MAG: phospho-sugar mutase, partial [Chthoniobacterales bacterium]
IVYTPLHGTGAVIIKPMLQRLGFQCFTVPEQEVPDSRFPTVKSPNPEYPEALSMGIALAEKENADLVMATDPDDDRMGIAARNAKGEMQLLTGNQIGSLMAWYRIHRYFELGVLNEKNRGHGVIIKTFVTTDLQKAIAEKFGLHCVETLTGFKYIGEKLGKYERQIPENLRKQYTQLSEAETRTLRLEHSFFYVFGGEESYGYSGSDFVRDKDGNSAVVMFAEVAAYAKSLDKTLPELLDEIYTEFGFFLERSESLTYDGAEGAAKIKKLVDSYATNPPKAIDGASVKKVRNFAIDDIHDSEGDLIPKEAMLILDIEGSLRVAVRPSGTEPKIKYYFFASETPQAGENLSTVKMRVADRLESLWQWLKADVDTRLAG